MCVFAFCVCVVDFLSCLWWVVSSVVACVLARTYFGNLFVWWKAWLLRVEWPIESLHVVGAGTGASGNLPTGSADVTGITPSTCVEGGRCARV